MFSIQWKHKHVRKNKCHFEVTSSGSLMHMFCLTAETVATTQHLVIIPLGTNLSEELNIQKRDSPLAGPSFTNSWPSPFPHFPHRTWGNTLYTRIRIFQQLYEICIYSINKTNHLFSLSASNKQINGFFFF